MIPPEGGTTNQSLPHCSTMRIPIESGLFFRNAISKMWAGCPHPAFGRQILRGGGIAPTQLSRLVAIGVVAVTATVGLAQSLPRTEWGAPNVNVSSANAIWTVAGQKQSFTLDRATLGLSVKAGPVTWAMVASKAGDLVVRAGSEAVSLRLADAQKVDVASFDSGANTGVQVVLNNWRHGATTIDLPITLTIAFDGANEELVFGVTADETHGAVVRQLDWPQALDAHEVDFTVLNHYRGILLPRDWPTAYNPIRGDKDYPNDTSEIQSDVVECWSQPWWGFQKGGAGMMVIVETPDDGAYQWDHPAGGPTVIGPRWRAQLGRLGYVRTARMVFFAQGNYVDMAKRYRAYAMTAGTWVPLTEKIAREPRVAQLLGGIESRVGILRNIVPESRLFKKDQPDRNHTLTTFAERAKQLRELKASGVERFNLVLTGWPRLGYDRQHPDVLPPAPEAGGYEGLKQLADTCRELGYLFSLHDQYRDYYVDAPSYNTEFAVHEEDAAGQPTGFPGTRFGSWKEGQLSFLAAWDGGKQTYFNARFMLPHVEKNYAGLFAHGIRPDGSYFDVFGYVPPDEDFNPHHPTTRTDAKRATAEVFRWGRANLGVIGTEAGCDWTAPYVDYTSPLGPGQAGIPVPLFALVYHDAVIVQYSPSSGGGEARMNREDRPNWLFGMINAGMPRAGFPLRGERDAINQMTALHRRVGLLELTKHEFLDGKFRRERSTFADGTTVTVDWDAKTAQVSPEQK
jgi:hypothetical protein